MSIALGIVMDPIEKINIKKDSSFAMLLEAQRREYRIHYLTPGNLWTEDGRARGRWRHLRLQDDPSGWFEFTGEGEGPLAELDCILMRKDPPFDLEYINDTYALERAADEGVLVVNRPQALRDANEKYFTAWFPDLCPPGVFSRDIPTLKKFVRSHAKSVVKPVDAMGGQSIFLLRRDDPNINVVLETVSHNGARTLLAQKFIEEIDQGDKRILLVDGEAIPYALARIPGADDFRGNLARGATGHGVELSDRDWEICRAVGPELSRRGILFAGIDVIGDYLTEINVTSPTCIRELDQIFSLNIAGTLFDRIEQELS
ncbi:MAG: glutathione synthase [Xanthomonadales bacterium]|nr:glutathione synthase [Xanthomonadales bacterium]